MSPHTAVLDADMIIGLAKGGAFDRLQALFAALYVPPGVVREVIIEGHGRAGEQELASALGAWITEVVPDPHSVQQFSHHLSLTDREVLAVARDRAVTYVLTNDRDLRREASQQGLVSLQTPSVVVLCKDQGLIPQVRPVLDRMRQQGFGLDDQSYEDALQSAGEWPTP